MLDWKIFAASIAALLIISTLLIGGSGIGGFFGSVGKTIGDWLGNSPFGGFFGSSSPKTNEVDLTLHPRNLTLKSESAVNITTPSIILEEFNGKIRIDFESNTLTLEESNSPLKLNLDLQNITIEKIKIGRLAIENTEFEIKPNITTDNGTIEMVNFIGRCTIEENSIKLKGNLSILAVRIGDLNWKIS